MLLFRIVTFTLIIVGGVTVLIPFLLVQSAASFMPLNLGIFRWTGIPLIFAGAAIYFWCTAEFYLRGRGTPAIYEPPKFLVLQGLYRFVRNPIYISYFLIVLGAAVNFQSAILFIYTAILVFLYHLFVTEIEEPGLRQKFGKSYQDYCKSVPRWLPSLRKRRV